MCWMRRFAATVLSALLIGLCTVTAFGGENAKSETPGWNETKGCYEIATAEQLYGFAQLVSDGETDASAVLVADIVVNAEQTIEENENAMVWVPIGTKENGYAGVFDGQGYSISGLYFADTASATGKYVGLFGYVSSGAEVKNLRVLDSLFQGYQYVAGLVGYNAGGHVENCVSDAVVVSAGDSSGGIVGKNDEGTVLNCTNTGAVSAQGKYVGGIVGDNDSGVVTECKNTGAISSTKSQIGGVVGSNSYGEVLACCNEGTVDGKNRLGGVAGENMGTVQNSSNAGAVTGTGDYVGGVTGYHYSTEACILKSYNTGAVTGVNYVGGVAGYGYTTSGTTTSCYNLGTVAGKKYVGGIIGRNYKGCVTNCYSAASVQASTVYAGGVVGYLAGGTVTDCFYLAEAIQDGDGTEQYGIGTGSAGTVLEDVAGSTTALAREAFSTGEATYLLNASLTEEERVWYQNLDTDSMPGFAGGVVYRVTDCDGVAMVYRNTNAPVDHSWNSGEITTKPTCEEKGVKTRTCQNCGETKTEEVAALGHSYASQVVEPDCTSRGYTVHTCEHCGDSYRDSYTEKLEHNWDAGRITVEAGCLTTGEICYTCQSCGETKKASVAATGHDWDSAEITTEPTCETAGARTYTCQNCGGTKTEEVAALGHSYASQVVEPGCTSQGYTVHTCERCGDSYRDSYTEKLGHDWDSTEITTEPTCETEGIRTYTCRSCGETKTEEVAALGHSYTAEIVKPGCTSQGYTRYTCERCGDSYQNHVTEALGHSWDEGSVTTAPTALRDGEMTYTCQTCGETRTESIAALGCSFTDLVENSTYYEAVLWAVDRNITNGITSESYGPKVDCTRAQILTFLWRYAGKPEPTVTEHNFTDIVEDSSYYKAVLWALEQGITNGTSATTFSPKVTCTRAQIVTFLWRYAGKPEPTVTEHDFTDIVEDSSYYKAVLWAIELEITNGITATTFGPKVTCTRARAMTFLWRYHRMK